MLTRPFQRVDALPLSQTITKRLMLFRYLFGLADDAAKLPLAIGESSAYDEETSFEPLVLLPPTDRNIGLRSGPCNIPCPQGAWLGGHLGRLHCVKEVGDLRTE